MHAAEITTMQWMTIIGYIIKSADWSNQIFSSVSESGQKGNKQVKSSTDFFFFNNFQKIIAAWQNKMNKEK